ncbi:hypothetical protein HF324_24760 [Chitinophaga oryzae]|uniref:DUF7674 domain-containing protein n=1 Tax=Chitinophaga oryzae TaxID=2725414 RepID=A0AAE6ZKF2_9BACT|nr:hypothetical protein [Chitinophaga oryzae]QJB34357.1 hypothetical protein HF329_24900 [Chitinophaga oryzae]QJB40876.1 hypothetical protein HF324_24760 [Chitinophaga oryzae]
MINQYEVPAYIEDHIPALKKALHQFPAIFHIYDTVGCFSEYTDRQLREQNFPVAGRCLQLAGKLYERGNEVVRGAITRVFVPALSKVPLGDAVNRIRIYGLIPDAIYGLYIQQQLIYNGNR